MHIDDLTARLPEFMQFLGSVKATIAPADFGWYPYGTLYNVSHLDRLLTEEYRNLGPLVGSRRVADVGGADGELAFYFEREGAAVDVIDCAATNYNGLRGARALKEALDSEVRVFDVNLDAQFDLPEQEYGLVLFLGILYHLKNPYFVLERLAQKAEWCLLSTRIARLTPDGSASLKDYPLAYLLDPTELNDDNTNYWIFSESGLKRLLYRTGWELKDFVSIGNTTNSDPIRPERDERAFCLMRSKLAGA